MDCSQRAKLTTATSTTLTARPPRPGGAAGQIRHPVRPHDRQQHADAGAGPGRRPQGDRGVNAETIWNYPQGQGQRTNADHAVVVTGVDTRSNIVHLNDSGTPNGRDEQIPMDTFSQAWATGDNLLIVTRQTGSP
ncbi:hypothetical protein I552_8857 [Mycobacterium xenopi 3993]|nr:hypothetical protein I552_8857 [Mycobacterium xenopi 3993]